MTEYKTATPRIAAYAILRKDGKVAFVLRSNTNWMDGYYGLPSGKVERNEKYTAGVIREASEEVGIVVKPEDLRVVHVMHRNADSSWVDVYFEVKAWQGEVVNAEPHKHSEVAWLDPKNLPENVIPPVAFAFAQMAAGNTYSEYGWS